MEMDFLDTFAGADGAYLTAVSGAVGKEIIARLQNRGSRERVLQRLSYLQSKLGISAAWTVDSEEFKVCMDPLANVIKIRSVSVASVFRILVQYSFL